jgi:YHS domain-containing protein
MKPLLFLLLNLFTFSSFAADSIYTGFFSNKALDGYDTVAYFTEGKPVEGDSQWQVEYQGADWYFSSEQNLEMFKADPERYAPQYGGYCAWAISAKSDFAPGDPQYWAVVNDKLYLNYDADIKSRWDDDRSGHIKQGDANWVHLEP